MKCMPLQAPGGLDKFVMVNAAEPAAPKPGEITVRLHANSLNYHDYVIAIGQLKTADNRIPMSDGAGVVTLTISAENTTSNPVTFQVNSLPASEIALAGLTLSTNETTGGNSVTGTVSLNGVARANGFLVSLRSSDLTLPVPLTVTIAQGQVSATFTISTPTTGTVQNATISAEASTGTLTASLQIDTSNLPQLDVFTVTPATVQGGKSLSGTVELSAAAPLGGVNVQLASRDAVAQPPASVLSSVTAMPTWPSACLQYSASRPQTSP